MPLGLILLVVVLLGAIATAFFARQMRGYTPGKTDSAKQSYPQPPRHSASTDSKSPQRPVDRLPSDAREAPREKESSVWPYEWFWDD